MQLGRFIWAFAIISFMTPMGSLAQNELEGLEDLTLGDLLNLEVESASRKKESIREAPVPISVITKEMIKASGVRNIHEAMVTFVPGYTDAEDRNEINFAPRGIYATSQQKVLIMINGHRLNSRSYLTAQPDYSISMHNVERIEVLRGPGSSLYGNVALGGVINVILKKGKDVNGTSVDVGMGNAGQKRLRLMHGSGDDNYDMLMWGQFYQADGEKIDLTSSDDHFVTGANEGDIFIDRVDDAPAHDFGVNYTKGEWTFFGSSKQSKWGEPYANNGAAGSYETTNTREFLGTGPGLGILHNNIGIKFNRNMGGGWHLNVNPYYDSAHIAAVLVTSADSNGLAISWRDQDIGIIVSVDKDYETGFGTGNFMFGIQEDAFEVYDSLQLGITAGDFNGTIGNGGEQLLEPGSEVIHSVFFQNKHFFNEYFLVNWGARFDEKDRRTTKNRNAFSPRVALIYLPNQNWEFKLSYSESFVDSPYWYRYNSLSLFGGSVNTDPELLSATQFQTTWSSDDKKLRNSTTVYYQNGKDLLTFRGTAAGTEADPKYINSGRVESWGVENEFAILNPQWQTFFNFQYYQAASSKDYTIHDDMFTHVPGITANVVFNYFFNKDMMVNTTLRYIGEQRYDDGADNPIDVDAAFLVNLGFRYENLGTKGLSLDLRAYNVLDEEHHQGGQGATQVPFRQAGVWYMGTLGYSF